MLYTLTSKRQVYPADLHTPVGLYIKIRNYFSEAILWETTDPTSGARRSLIGFDPLARFYLDENRIFKCYPGSVPSEEPLNSREDLLEQLRKFRQSFSLADKSTKCSCGFYGHINYDAVRYFEDIDLRAEQDENKRIPDIHFVFYRFFIVYDHSSQQIEFIEYTGPGICDDLGEKRSFITTTLANTLLPPQNPFACRGAERSGFSDDEFLKLIRKAKEHCLRGDVFQLVLSRSFSIEYQGDDLEVFRALRSINPSPYQFYFDFGSYRLLGCSPEVQLRISGRRASIYPIAGTYRRTGDEEKDRELGRELLSDPKENAEHTMLVDLARNDLSKKFRTVTLKKYKEIQYFSHVVHMTSEVCGENEIEGHDSLNIITDTFPAGTLSGAPKHRAMQLIDQYERKARGFYGGSIGFLGIDGELDQAILIRSILSKDSCLYYQAGAGIVASSDINSEAAEINHKLAAIREAIQTAARRKSMSTAKNDTVKFKTGSL